MISSDVPTTPAPDAGREPLRYHRLALSLPWWRPLATVAVAVVFYTALVIVAAVVAVLVGAVSPAVAEVVERTATADVDMEDPLVVAEMLVLVALLLPACRLAAATTGGRGMLDSVAGHIRWGLLARALLPAVGVVGLVLGLEYARARTAPAVSPTTGALVIVAVLLVPFQAAGEEYVFRGLPLQVLGRWLRSPVWGALISVPVFVVGHDYGPPGLVAVVAFALAATWIVWRTGGLEVVIAWHVVTNTAGFVLQAYGVIDPQASDNWASALLDVAGSIAMVVLVEVLWRRSWAVRYTAVRLGADAPQRPGQARRPPVAGPSAPTPYHPLTGSR